jgi:hypothetical protein
MVLWLWAMLLWLWAMVVAQLTQPAVVQLKQSAAAWR